MESEGKSAVMPAATYTLLDLQTFLEHHRGVQFHLKVRDNEYRASLHIVGGRRSSGGMLVSANGDSLDDAVEELMHRYKHDFERHDAERA
jgi:hypothetical protein